MFSTYTLGVATTALTYLLFGEAPMIFVTFALAVLMLRRIELRARREPRVRYVFNDVESRRRARLRWERAEEIYADHEARRHAETTGTRT